MLSRWITSATIIFKCGPLRTRFDVDPQVAFNDVSPLIPLLSCDHWPFPLEDLRCCLWAADLSLLAISLLFALDKWPPLSNRGLAVLVDYSITRLSLTVEGGEREEEGAWTAIAWVAFLPGVAATRPAWTAILPRRRATNGRPSWPDRLHHKTCLDGQLAWTACSSSAQEDYRVPWTLPFVSVQLLILSLLA